MPQPDETPHETPVAPPTDALELDRLIHEPARLAILTVLSSVRSADFVFLQRTTGLTKGNLSSHLTKLEDGGLVSIEKTFLHKKPHTRAALTDEGTTRVAEHWQRLERLKELAQRRPDSAPAPIPSRPGQTGDKSAGNGTSPAR